MSDLVMGDLALLEPTTNTARSKVFDTLTLKQAKAIIALRADPEAEINRKFRNGDHWQRGTGWVGPSRLSSTPTVQDAALKAIKSTFVFRNIIGEVDSRHVNGVLGRTTHWRQSVKRPLKDVEETDPDTGQKLVKKEEPKEEETALIAEAELALVAWWDKRQITKQLKTALSSTLNTGRGLLRLYVSPGSADEEGNVPAGSLEECLDLLFLTHMGTNEDTLKLQFPSATVYIDKASRREIGVFTYRELLPSATGKAQKREDRAELTYLSEDGDTILRVINDKGDIEPPMVLPLGGRLTMYEMTREPLISEAIVSQQKQFNMHSSMKGRNGVVAGYLERIFFNVDWPGTTTTVDGVTKFTPEPINIGAGMLTSLQGAKYTDEEGNAKFRDPSVHYRDPVSPATFIESEDSTYGSILHEAHQAHVLITGDAVASAISRVQAREEFKADLQNSANEVQAAIRWILETALAWAAYFAARALVFEALRVYAQCKVDSGPVGPEELRAYTEMWEKGVWAKETTQSATGIEDVDAENQRIKLEQAEQSKADAEGMARAQKLIDKINPPEPEPDGEPVKKAAPVAA